MWLIFLLFIPTIVLLVGMAISNGKVTFKEFLLSEAIMCLLVAGGYSIAKHQSVSDIEIWNGWMAKAEYYEEWWEQVSCRHEIRCTHRDEKGNTLHSNDGHYHLYDVDYHSPYWEGKTSNGETLSLSHLYYDELVGLFKNQEYVTILRFSKDHGRGNKYVTSYDQAMSTFVSTAVPHSFVNYIKASPSSVLRKVGQGDSFKNLLPEYPTVDQSNWSAKRFLSVGVPIVHLSELNLMLSVLNGRLGGSKQVNAMIIAVNTLDSSYIQEFEEKWLGGKKNDLIIVIGCVEYPKISWVRVTSWSTSEDLKIELRDKILDVGTFERSNEILGLVEKGIKEKFIRRKMADFEYLMAGWQPSAGIMAFLIILGFVVSIGLTVYCTKEDVFGEDRRYRY